MTVVNFEQNIPFNIFALNIREIALTVLTGEPVEVKFFLWLLKNIPAYKCTLAQ